MRQIFPSEVVIVLEPVTIPELYRTFALALTVQGVVNVIAASVAVMRSFFIVVISLPGMKFYFILWYCQLCVFRHFQFIMPGTNSKNLCCCF